MLTLSELIPGGGVGQLILEDIFTENMLATFLLVSQGMYVCLYRNIRKIQIKKNPKNLGSHAIC